MISIKTLNTVSSHSISLEGALKPDLAATLKVHSDLIRHATHSVKFPMQINCIQLSLYKTMIKLSN